MQYAYAPAAQDYEYVLRKRNDPQAVFNIADSYRQMGNPTKTEYWYRRAVKLPGALPEYNLYLAEALMRNAKYAEAEEYLRYYLELNKTDYRAQRMLESCENIDLFYRDTTLYTVSLLKVNTPGENYFSPAFYRSGLVFLSDKPMKGLSRTVSDGNGRRYLDLFYAKRTDKGHWLDMEPLRGEVNGRFNEGPVVFTKDFNTMYFTRNNYESNKVEKNKRNVNVLKIYKAEAIDGEWMLRGEMYFNNGDYSVGHPALNSDGTTLYFVSDMPWGYGGTDIYSVKWEGGNTWSAPVNLGPSVNTEGNEMFPSIQNDTILYFSSDGLPGIGGLDIYESRYYAGNWGEPVNVGAPVNSSADDFAYIADSTGLNGYFSSARTGNGDKLYGFTKNPPQLIIRISVNDAQTGSPVPGAELLLKHSGKDTLMRTDGNGVIRIKGIPETDYSLAFDHRDYYWESTTFSTGGKRFSETIDLKMQVKPVILNKPFIWENVAFKKKDWQLQLNSGTALESLVKMLEENPRLIIEVGSYTDSRGSDKENLALTQRRAELVQQYLQSRGIKAERLTAKGYGEAKLLNKCVNGILCIEEEHQQNNRIEITVKAVSKDTAQK